jgi:hypothetical protein
VLLPRISDVGTEAQSYRPLPIMDSTTFDRGVGIGDSSAGATADHQQPRWKAGGRPQPNLLDHAERSAISGLCDLFCYERAYRHPQRITPPRLRLLF